TFADPRFVTYMGSPDRDLRTDIRFTEHRDEAKDELLAAMRSDPSITDITVIGASLYRIDGLEGTRSQLVDTGDHSRAGTRYVSGTAPGDGEISLSVLAAVTYGGYVGDAHDLDVDSCGLHTPVSVCTL